MSSRLHRTYLAVCVLLLAVEGRSRAARGWPCLYREKIGVGRRACLYRESRALRLRMSGGCGEDSAYSVSAPEYEGPKLPKADDSAPPPRSILKVSDDGEIWVDREGQEHDDSLCDAGRERKVVETYDLGPDVLCSCESCTGNINGDHQPAGCVRTTKRRGEGWDRQSGDFARPEIAGKGMQDLRAQGSGFASSAAGQAEVHLSGSVQGKGCEVTEVQQMGEGNGCEPVEWEDDSRGAPSADLSDGDFGFGDSLDFHDDGIAKTPDTSGQRCPEGPSISEQLNHTAERAGDKQSPSQDFGIRSESSWPPGLDSGSFGSFAAPTKTDSDFMWAMRMGDEEAAADARSRGASRQALDDQLLEAAKVRLGVGVRTGRSMRARRHACYVLVGAFSRATGHNLI